MPFKAILQKILSDQQKFDSFLENNSTLSAWIKEHDALESELEILRSQISNPPDDLAKKLEDLAQRITQFNLQDVNFNFDGLNQDDIKGISRFAKLSNLPCYASADYLNLIQFAMNGYENYAEDLKQIRRAIETGTNQVGESTLDEFLEREINFLNSAIAYFDTQYTNLRAIKAPITLFETFIPNLINMLAFCRYLQSEGVKACYDHQNGRYEDNAQNFLDHIQFDSAQLDNQLEEMDRKMELSPNLELLQFQIPAGLDKLFGNESFCELMMQRNALYYGLQSVVLRGEYRADLEEDLEEFARVNRQIDEFEYGDLDSQEIKTACLIPESSVFIQDKIPLVLINGMNYYANYVMSKAYDAYHHLADNLHIAENAKAKGEADRQHWDESCVAFGEDVDRLNSELDDISLKFESADIPSHLFLTLKENLMHMKEAVQNANAAQLLDDTPENQAMIHEYREQAKKAHAQIHRTDVHAEAYDEMRSALLTKSREQLQALTTQLQESEQRVEPEKPVQATIESKGLHEIREQDIIIHKPNLGSSKKPGNYRIKNQHGTNIYPDNSEGEDAWLITNKKTAIEEALEKTYDILNQEFAEILNQERQGIIDIKLQDGERCIAAIASGGKNAKVVILDAEGQPRDLSDEEKRAYQTYYKNRIQDIADDVFAENPKLKGLSPNFHTGKTSRLKVQPKRTRSPSPQRMRKRARAPPDLRSLQDRYNLSHSDIAELESLSKTYREFARSLAENSENLDEQGKLNPSAQAELTQFIQEVSQDITNESLKAAARQQLTMLHNEIKQKIHQAPAIIPGLEIFELQNLTYAQQTALINDNEQIQVLGERAQQVMKKCREFQQNANENQVVLSQEHIQLMKEVGHLNSELADLDLSDPTLEGLNLENKFKIYAEVFMHEGKVPFILHDLYLTLPENVQTFHEATERIIENLSQEEEVALSDYDVAADIEENIEYIEDVWLKAYQPLMDEVDCPALNALVNQLQDYATWLKACQNISEDGLSPKLLQDFRAVNLQQLIENADAELATFYQNEQNPDLLEFQSKLLENHTPEPPSSARLVY